MYDYVNPIKEQYHFPAKSFGAAGETGSMSFYGPKGKRGLVRDIMVNITEDMVGTTSVPEINVGAAASAVGSLSTTYARFRLGTAAGAGYTAAGGARRASQLLSDKSQPRTLSDFAGHVALETALLPADTLFYISWVEGVDGTETGAGDIYVWIDWF